MKIAKPHETVASMQPGGCSPEQRSGRGRLAKQLRGMSYEEGAQALQPKAAPGGQFAGGDHSQGAHGVARAAFRGPAQALPHRGAIESSYGVDMGAVQAYTGPAAASAPKGRQGGRAIWVWVRLFG